MPRRLSLSSACSPLVGPLSPPVGVLPSPRTRLGSGTYGLDAVSSQGDGSWRKRDADPGRPIGDHAVDERDEDTGGEEPSGIALSGSLTDADMTRSAFARSMAPSPPSFPSFLRRQESAEDAMSKLGGLTLLDQETKSGGDDAPDARPNPLDPDSAPAINGGISAARPPGLEADPLNASWSYRDPKGNIQGTSCSASHVCLSDFCIRPFRCDIDAKVV